MKCCFERLRKDWLLSAGLVLAVALVCSAPRAEAEDALLAETVEFTGFFIHATAKSPGLVIGAIRNGETVVRGFGEISDGSGKAPDGDTMMRIGSITKAFTGATLASMAADGKVQFTDKLQDRLGWDVTIPELGGKSIRLIDLATHSAGLPREAQIGPLGEGGDPKKLTTKEDYIASLKQFPLLYPPGTGMLYSNFGFDLLAQALANSAGKPYPELLKERVLDPAGLKDTVFDLRPGDEARAMRGHNFDGSQMPLSQTSPMIVGAGGLYSTANDMLRWLKWHLDRFADEDAEMRLLDHRAYLNRDGLNPVFGFGEAAHMDEMGLAWVVMQPEGDRPLILQKSGGLQGQFSYIAFAPARGVGVFVSINEFNAAGFGEMAKAVNDLITELAPR
jgi:D-alanyl-D-alanine-carboxypeptidase/D-alanyl-D-alanine-endopeptidase